MRTRVVYFVDGQNLYHRCREHFGHPWVHPRRLAEALVGQDQERHGPGSHVLSAVRYYTGIHDPNRRPDAHGAMARRLQAYAEQGIGVFPMPLRYDHRGRGREKGVDVRIAIDLTRLGWKGLYDVAVIVSEDSDLDPAAQDVYALRDSERWVAVENALPWTPTSHTQWLPSVKRRRPIDATCSRKSGMITSTRGRDWAGPASLCSARASKPSKPTRSEQRRPDDGFGRRRHVRAVDSQPSGMESEPSIWSVFGPPEVAKR